MNSTASQKNKDSKSGRWKDSQNSRFMKALEKYGRNWVKVQKMVKTRSLAQVRSHAQKTFINMSQVDILALISPQGNDRSCFKENKKVLVKRNEKNLHEKITKIETQSQQRSPFYRNCKQCSQIRSESQIDQQKCMNKIQEILEVKQNRQIENEHLKNANKNEFPTSFFMEMFKINKQYFYQGGNFMDLFQKNIVKNDFQLFQ